MSVLESPGDWMPTLREEPLRRVRMSYDEWCALPQWPRAEWVGGEAVVSPDPTFRHQRIGRRTVELLEVCLHDLVVEGPLNLRLSPDRVRIPDFIVVVAEPDLFVEEVPVVVGEVLSPSTRREDLVIKAEEYAAAGIGQYWVVDPEARSIDVYANAGGHWEPLAVIDERHPTATVEVGEHGSVQCDLAAILDG